MFVGRDWTIVAHDLRTLYFNLFTEPRTPRRMFENIGLESSWGCKRNRGAVVEADAIAGEQQLKRTQSGSSSRSGCDRDQQLKWTQSRSSRRKRGAACS